METETLEDELEGFEHIGYRCGKEFLLLAKGQDRIVYDPKAKEIITRYRIADKIARGKIRI